MRRPPQKPKWVIKIRLNERNWYLTKERTWSDNPLDAELIHDYEAYQQYYSWLKNNLDGANIKCIQVRGKEQYRPNWI